MNQELESSWRLGLGMALLAMACWATLPVALGMGLEIMDPWSLTWFRFLVAAVLSLAWLGARGRLHRFRNLPAAVWLLLLVAAAMLTANYLFYLVGLDRTSPATAQVLIQLAPLLMALGGLALFGESYNRRQWAGFVVLVAGLGLFFNNQLRQLGKDLDTYLAGALLLVVAAVVWAVYALVQKRLQQRLAPSLILAFIYLFASLSLLPATEFGEFRGLGLAEWLILGYCALNTLGAYGAFSSALHHWQASRVSAVLALTPLGTLLLVKGMHWWQPQRFEAEVLGWVGWAGALMVVAGSMVTSLAGERKREIP